MTPRRRAALQSDRGTILPIVLVVSISLAFVVIALAKFVTTDLSFSRVTRDRAERQAAAVSAVTYGVERLKLGQTLCGAAVPSFGPIAPGLLDLNDTTTSLTCQRIGGTATDVTGWAAILTGNGVDVALAASGGGEKFINGPVFIEDVGEITISGGDVVHVDGDLWGGSVCPGPGIPARYRFDPSATRGLICSGTTWPLLFNPPAIPTLPANVVTTPTFDDGTCRVFPPGRYETAPDLSGAANVYFQSGVYLFDFAGPLTIANNQTVWFGNPGTTTPELTNAPCAAQVGADPDVEPGAAIYLDGGSIIRPVSNGGRVEFFPRNMSGQLLSIQQLDTSTVRPDDTPPTNDEAFFEIRSGGNPQVVIHGLVLAPHGEFTFDNNAGATQRLLGGLVVARLRIGASSAPNSLTIASSTSPASAKIELTATSTDAGGTTVVRAIVDYRPDAVLPRDRVAVNSLRVVD